MAADGLDSVMRAAAYRERVRDPVEEEAQKLFRIATHTLEGLSASSREAAIARLIAEIKAFLENGEGMTS